MGFWQHLLLFLINVCQGPSNCTNFWKEASFFISSRHFTASISTAEMSVQMHPSQGENTLFWAPALGCVMLSLTLERCQQQADCLLWPFGAGPSVLVPSGERRTASFKLKGDKLHLVLVCQEIQIRTWWGMLKKWGRRIRRWGVYLKKLKQRVGWGSKEEARKKSRELASGERGAR